MDQRIAVHEFERCAGPDGRVSIGATRRGTFHHEKRSQSFTATQHAMPHRREKPLGPEGFAARSIFMEQRVECLFDHAPALGKIGTKIGNLGRHAGAILSIEAATAFKSCQNPSPHARDIQRPSFCPGTHSVQNACRSGLAFLLYCLYKPLFPFPRERYKPYLCPRLRSFRWLFLNAKHHR